MHILTGVYVDGGWLYGLVRLCRALLPVHRTFFSQPRMNSSSDLNNTNLLAPLLANLSLNELISCFVLWLNRVILASMIEY